MMARASELDHNPVYSTRSEGEFRVCAASLSLFSELFLVVAGDGNHSG
jgi:hypothetical protein